ncbi:MAG: hypothetical protein V3V01_20785 [Acidimicrobiales bacterium]
MRKLGVIQALSGGDLTTPELIDAARGCDVIVAHRSTPGDAAVFERMPELVAFLRCAVDISTIDIDAASAHGVLVACADESFVASTAELALGLLIDSARNISASTGDYQSGPPNGSSPNGGAPRVSKARFKTRPSSAGSTLPSSLRSSCF